MKIADLFENWGLTKIKLSVGFMDAEWAPQPEDAEAAWELYVEMLTRVITQKLDANQGTEAAALASVYSLFPTTRQILKAKGRKSIAFAKIAIVVLNQIVRPFTAKWHPLAEAGQLKDAAMAKAFRTELAELQVDLRRYTQALADIAGVEDLTDMQP
jgi:hypothetical protein